MTSEQVRNAFANAEPEEPQKPALRDKIADLVQMDEADCLEASAAIATDYDVPRSEILKLVEKERGAGDDVASQGEAFVIDPPEPWDEAVDGEALADELRGEILRYVWLPKGAAEVVTLWILHTHVFGAWRISPRLYITSPTKNCGKSTLLNGILGRAVCKPMMASNVGPAVLFRAIAKWRPCLVIDEVDTFMRRNEELRGIVNSSHTADGYVLRCVGDDHEVRRFSTWAPMAMAGIGRVPETIEDRSIVIQLQRRTKAEPIKEINNLALERFETLARKAARWAEGVEHTLIDCQPELPDGMTNRLADNWKPLLTVAEAIGGEWPDAAREVAGAYHATQEETSAGVQALLDMAELFQLRGAEQLATSHVLDHLNEMDDRPWPEWKHGKPMTSTALGRLMGQFRIKPKPLRDSPTGRQYRGYERAPIDDAAQRYDPKNAVHTLPQPVNPSQCNEINSLEGTQPVTEKKICDGLKSDNPLKNNGCDDLTRWDRGKSEKNELRACPDEPHSRAHSFGKPLNGGNKTPSQGEDFEELAARLEFDEGLTRKEAEQRARNELVARGHG